MLVLARKENEKVLILKDGQLVCTVTLIRNRDHQGNVRLGFQAPQDVSILRKEVADRPIFKGVQK